MIRHSKLFLLIFSGFALGAFISICLQVQAGSLTPSGTPASTSVGTVPVADIVGSGYVTSTDSLRNNSIALSNISSSINSMIPDNGLTAAGGMYNNRIISMNPPAAYTEVCFKSGATYYDARSAGAATGGGNCSVGDVGYVIEKNQRNGVMWEAARQTCLQNNMRLPEPFEWKLSCKNSATWGLSSMPSGYEWASNSFFPMFDSPNGVYATVSIIFGGSGCGYSNWAGATIGGNVAGWEDTRVFRCAR